MMYSMVRIFSSHVVFRKKITVLVTCTTRKRPRSSFHSLLFMVPASLWAFKSDKLIYIRELLMSKTRISVAPTFWRASIFSETSVLSTKEDTDLTVPHSRDVTVGDRFPGVILTASSTNSLLTLYTIMTYFVAVMYP